MRRLYQAIKRELTQKEERAPEKPTSPIQLPPINVTQNIKENFGKVTGVIFNLPDPEAQSLREARATLITRVKAAWIGAEGAPRNRQGALQAIETDHHAFVSNGGLLRLPKHFTPDAVDFHSEASDVVAHLRATGNGVDPIPIEQPMSDLWREAQQSLLILGAPGVGKTVALLELARDALRAAEGDAEQPVPVIFDLASWANEQGSISDWIAQELTTIQYGIPKEITQRWLRNHDLLLLLDGLNELNDFLRRRCVAQINEFTAAYGAPPIVICCRTVHYHTLPVKLTLRTAITIEPLTGDQIAAYFAQAGAKLTGLHTALQGDPVLSDMATTPLMLHMMSIAYADVRLADIPADADQSPAVRRRHLFDLYIERMFRYGGAEGKPYTDAQTLRWLSWLAQQMERHHRPVFLIEHLQPSWLPSTAWQWGYILASRAVVGLLAGLVGGIVIGMGLAPTNGVAHAFQRGLAEGPLGAFLAGLTVGSFDMLWLTYLGRLPRLRALPLLWQSLIKILLTSLAVGVTVALGFALIFGSLHFMRGDFATWLAEGVQVGMVCGLSASLLFAFGPRAIRYSLHQDIQTVERVSWSRTRARRGGLIAIVIGLVAGAISGVVAQDTPMVQPLAARGMSNFAIIRTMAVIGGLVFSLIGLVFGGFTGTFRKIDKVTPNQGLRLSLINAGWVALTVSAIFAPVIGLIGFIISGGARGSLISYLFYGLFIGVLASLWYGGLFVLQHGVLRLLLWATGHTPPVGQYARLLDYAAQRIFLHKVGGGYKFVNRYLQDHFIALGETRQPSPAHRRQA